MEHPADQRHLITGQPKFATVLEDARQFRQIARPDEATAMVAGLGPRVGEQHEDPAHRCGRQRIDQVARIVGVNTDIPDAVSVDLAQKAPDTVDERLTADHADIRVSARLRGQMLPAAEADLEPDIRDRSTEQSRRFDAPAGQVDPKSRKK